MTKQEATKIAEEKYPLPKKQDYKNIISHSLCYKLDVEIQQHKRQAFIEGLLFALDPNNI